MLNENDFAPGRGSFNHQQWLTGPSTNGRSSAFGALCLGSNPSGPARTAVLSSQFSVELAETEILRTGNRDRRTAYGHCSDADRQDDGESRDEESACARRQ